MTLPTVIADGKTHSYTYDLLGRLSGTSLNTTTPYTTALTYKTHPSTGSSSHVLNSYRSGSTTTTYQVDANGNITQLSDGTYTFTYEYDNFNQLIRENNPLLNKSITYQYDLGGNLLAVNEYAYTTGTLGSLITSVPYTYVSAWKDQLTSIEGYGLTYDTNGNLLSYKTRSYSWQAGRQLTQITDTNLNAVYTYNESGIRTRKVVNEVITDVVLEGGKVILETTGSDTLHYSYDSRGQLVSFSLNGTPYFYTRNGQGDITGLIDASGVEVVRYTYDSWGKPISITGSLATTVGAKNPYRYRGYRYDHESGLYYLQSRYYDPSIKRFINADELIDNGSGILGYNVYSYCINNPVNMYDDDGYAPEYISKQYNNFEINGKKMKDISLGFGNIADHGCGVIAAFNLLLSRSSKVTFNNVKRGLIWRGGLNAGGFLGINPFVIANYMRSKFWFVFTAGPITFLWGVKAELSESVIVLIKWSGKGGMHYIAGIGTGNGGKGGSFKFYNTGIEDSNGKSIDGVEMSIWTFLDYVESYGATPIYFIGVKGKKGWW